MILFFIHNFKYRLAIFFYERIPMCECVYQYKTFIYILIYECIKKQVQTQYLLKRKSIYILTGCMNIGKMHYGIMQCIRISNFHTMLAMQKYLQTGRFRGSHSFYFPFIHDIILDCMP